VVEKTRLLLDHCDRLVDGFAASPAISISNTAP